MQKLILVLIATFLLSFSTLARAVKTVQYDLDKEVTYIGGSFKLDNKDGDLFTTPNQLTKSPKQSVGIYKGHPEIMPYEKILMRVTIGKDGRTQITNTTDWPYRIHAQLSMNFPDGEYGGSGVLIGPHHILTAGHNVFDHEKNKWVQHISVRLGLHNQAIPFGELKAVRVFTFKPWVKEGNPDYDLALLTLERSIGHETGWTGLLCLDDKKLLSSKVNITGYPGDKGFSQMWSMSHGIKKVEPERFFYDIDTYGGQSGSGIWINQWSSPYVVGIHTLGENGLYTGNSGVRLSKSKFDVIVKEWIESTLVIQQKVSITTASKKGGYSKADSDSDDDISNQFKIAVAIKGKTSSNDADQYYQQGLQLSNAKKNKDAFSYYLKAAELGHGRSQFQVAKYYLQGEIVHKDVMMAALWMEKAAKQGHVQAQYSFGVMYIKGAGVYKDSEQAKYWLQQAANQKNNKKVRQLAMKELAPLLEKDFKLSEALKLYKELALEGDSDAQFKVGYMYQYGQQDSVYGSFNSSEAVKWYRMAAENDHTEAQYNLGFIYSMSHDGREIKEDRLEAIKWLTKAANKGHEEAKKQLAWAKEHFAKFPTMTLPSKSTSWF